jgi:hypothetical protein
MENEELGKKEKKRLQQTRVAFSLSLSLKNRKNLFVFFSSIMIFERFELKALYILPLFLFLSLSLSFFLFLAQLLFRCV